MIKLTQLRAKRESDGTWSFVEVGPIWLNPRHIASVVTWNGVTAIGTLEPCEGVEGQVWRVREAPEIVVDSMMEIQG